MSLSPVSARSGPGYATRLRSINLRPTIQGPSGGSTPSSSDGTSGSSNQQESTGPSAGENSRGSRNQSGNNPPSSSNLNPSTQFTVISGNRPGTIQPPESRDGSTDSIPGNDTGSSDGGSKGPTELSPAERRKVQELKRVDAQVRAHEQAHLAAAGQYAQGGISFETVTGPDGNEYAVAGEVSLDTSGADSPRETVKKMRQVKAAALAPAEPSPQDQSIAAQAARKLSEAQRKRSQDSSEQQSLFDQSSPSTQGSEENSSESSTGIEGPEDFGATPENSKGNSTGSVAGRGSARPSDASQSPSGRSSRIDQFLSNAPSDLSNQSSGQRLNLLV